MVAAVGHMPHLRHHLPVPLTGASESDAGPHGDGHGVYPGSFGVHGIQRHLPLDPGHNPAH